MAFPGGPGGFRELREAGRIHFHLSWYLVVPVVTSYGQKSWGGEIFLPGTVGAPYAKKLIVLNVFFLENFGANKLGSIAYETASNRCRKVEETQENMSAKFSARNTSREVITKKLINFANIKFTSIEV